MKPKFKKTTKNQPHEKEKLYSTIPARRRSTTVQLSNSYSTKRIYKRASINLRIKSTTTNPDADKRKSKMTGQQRNTEEGQLLAQLEHKHSSLLNRQGYYSKGVARLAERIEKLKLKIDKLFPNEKPIAFNNQQQ